METFTICESKSTDTSTAITPMTCWLLSIMGRQKRRGISSSLVTCFDCLQLAKPVSTASLYQSCST